ncbi:MAG: hypothetical protein LWW98_08065 [Deltaproteobacteria bacterium]|nr:hypothetical protein [Deltaproteobacteria bacterium]
MLKSYLKKIFKIANQGDAREESYYSTLDELFKKIAQSFGKSKIHITTPPKSTEAGNPDFRIWDGKQHIVGYATKIRRDKCIFGKQNNLQHS